MVRVHAGSRATQGCLEAVGGFLSEILWVAEENASRREHALDREVGEHLSIIGRFVKECPRAGGTG